MSRRVDRVAAALGRPPEDLEAAMRKHAVLRSGPDEGRIATLSVRLGCGRTFTYERPTSMSKVARELGITVERLRFVMRVVAADEGKVGGTWTMSVRVW